MNKILILGTVSLVLSLPVFADSWPTFSYPHHQQLLNSNYLDTQTCPRGEARLIPDSSININQNNCRGWCPPEWVWIAKSDGNCHKLSDISFKGYQFAYYPNNYDWLYSTVTASYGEKNSDKIFFQFVLKTLPVEYWYCTNFQPDMDFVTCANDF